MRPRTLVIGVVAVVLLGLVAVWGLRRSVPPADAPPGATAGAEGTPAAPDDAMAPSPSPDATTPVVAEPPPPWALGLGEAPAVDAAPAAPASAEEARRAAQMAKLRESMDALVGDALDRSEASTVHVRKALDALEALDDPAVKAQIDLGAVRHNLEVSARMQALLRELRQTMAEPRTPERQQRIDALRAEFQGLQAQIRTDVTPPGATLPVPAAPPAPAAANAPRGG
jgi:hypothetical protein